MNFNSNNIETMRLKLQQTLNEFSNQNELGPIHIGTIRYGNDEFRCKIEVKNTYTQQVVPQITNTTPVAVGDVFVNNRTRYTVTGTTNPGIFSISVVTQNGKRYKIKPATLNTFTKIK